MKKKKLLLILLVPFIISAAQEEGFLESLEKYHTIISKWILDKTDLVDRYLVDKNDTKRENKTLIDLSFELGKFTQESGFYHNLAFSLQLDLPRLENKFKLKFQKVPQNSGTLLNEKDKENLLAKDDEKKKYNLSLNYSPLAKENFFFSISGGAQFDELMINPYVNLVTGYKFKKSKKEDIFLKNSLRFYLGGEVKDLLIGQYFYQYQKDMVLGWIGSFVYSNKSSYQDMTSEFFALKELNKHSFYRIGFAATAHLKNFKHAHKGDFELYARYHNKLLNKKWLYYEITPSLNWKRKEHYKTSVGIKVKIGATFGALK
jgi:hypothetical protein